MRLFGWKGAASPRPVLSRVRTMGGMSGGALSLGGTMVEGMANYESHIRSSILSNPIAQRAMRLVTEAAGGAAIMAQGASAAENAQAKELVRHISAGQGLIEMLAMHLMLHGNAYVQIITDDAGNPAELFALRPERVSVDLDAQGWPVAYIYRVGERRARLDAEDSGGRPAILHLKAGHPLDDHYGLGCLGVATGPVAIHNAATRWNRALLDNAARPSGALIYDGKDGMSLSADQFARLKEELESAFQGASNAGRPMLLEGGLSWQTLSMSPSEMDFVALKEGAAREIALAFGVPPLLLGLPGDNSYANYREANKALWRQTVLPLLAKILGGLAQGLRGWMPGLVLSADTDSVPELAEERSVHWDRVSAADFLNADEKRSLLGLSDAVTKERERA